MSEAWKLYVAGARRGLLQAVGACTMYGDDAGHGYSRRAAAALRVFIPYCVHPVAGAAGVLIWLNRNYKPLGVFGGPDHGCGNEPFVDYGHFPHLHLHAESPAAVYLAKFCKAEAGRPIWLFTDGVAPWISKAGAERLARLLEAALAAGSEQPAALVAGPYVGAPRTDTQRLESALVGPR